MIYEELSREELLARLRTLVAEVGVDKREHERLVHDLQVHQLELELQNRDLREAQSALEESRNRYADLYDFAPIAYFTFDERGRIQEVNLTGATLIGRDRGQLIGAPFPVLVQMADSAQFWAHLRRCAASRVPVVTEFALTTRVSGAMQLRAVSSPVAGPDGHPIGFRTAFIDMTDRHQAELARDQALESERSLRHELEVLDQAKTTLARSLATVTEHSLSAILQIVVDQARAIGDAEYAALAVAGASSDTFQAWSFSGIAPHEEAAIGAPPRIVGTLAAAFHGAAALRLKDLSTHPAFAGFPPHHPLMRSLLAVPVRFGERLVGTLYLASKRGGAEFSIDDQFLIESLARYVGVAMEIARLGDEAQDAIRSRDNLLATVSHDLRSPLSAISISARLLMRMLVSTEELTARRQAETISRAATRMRRFIDDLLTASTLDAGRLLVSVRPEPLDQIVAEATDMLAYEVAESSLVLVADVPAGLPEVLCDRDRVHQVLANLVSNAIKFTPPGGRVTIEVRPHGDELHVVVRDNGPGIPEAALPLIFERYWTKDAAASGRRGTGLGLYICKGIVESHGGRIWVESTVGEGTRVGFSLPVAVPHPAG